MQHLNQARWLKVGAILLFCFGAALNHQLNHSERSAYTETLYFPDNATFTHASWGYNRAMADLLWMMTLAYFGGHYQERSTLTPLEDMLQSILSLNPRHESAYYMATAILPWIGDSLDASVRLNAKAMAYLPKEGKWAYRMGFNQYLFDNDKRAAQHFLAVAISRGYVNRLTASLAIKLKAETEGLAEAHRYLFNALQHEPDKRVRSYLSMQLKAVETEAILRKLDTAIARLKRQGIAIDSLQALQEAGIRWPSPLPDGGTLTYKDSRIYSSATPKRLKLFRSRKASRIQQMKESHG